jgi:hypothetical protein
MHSGDIGRFTTLINAKMANMNAMLLKHNGTQLLTHGLGIGTGPCAFLAVVPSTFSGFVQVEVIHSIQQYKIPASQPNSATDPLQGRMVVFMGKINLGQLPMMMLEPALGLPNFFLSQMTTVPNKAMTKAFYAAHDHQELVPSQTVATNLDNHQMLYMALIPMPFVPAFIKGLSPQAALVRAWGRSDAPPPRQAQYGYGQQDAIFGETAGPRAPEAPHVNPHTNTILKANLDKVRQADPNITMMGLLRGSLVKLNQVVLVDGNCVNFHAFGICHRGALCKVQHDPTARPSSDQVANFMDLVKPLAKGFLNWQPAKQARAVGPGA